MVDYSKSKIYKIEPINSEDEGDVYIGSTTKDTLAQRMTAHRGSYKNWKKGVGNKISSYTLFEKYGLENCSIFLIEMFPCNSKDELRSREGFFIKSMKCVNKKIAGRTSKILYEENKPVFKIRNKEYYLNNKSERLLYHKEYNEKNKDKLNAYQKEYQKEYYFEITKQKPNIICDCGSNFKYKYKSEHLKTKKHQAYLLQCFT